MIDLIAHNWQPFLIGAGAGITTLMGYVANHEDLKNTKFQKGTVWIVSKESPQFAGREVIITRDWELRAHDSYATVSLILNEEETKNKKEEYKDLYKKYLEEYKTYLEYNKKNKSTEEDYHQRLLQQYSAQMYSPSGYGGQGGGGYYQPSQPNPPSEPYILSEPTLLPTRYLENKDKEEIIKVKKGGHKMPKVFKWTLYAALCSLVWQVVGNAPAIAQFIISLFIK